MIIKSMFYLNFNRILKEILYKMESDFNANPKTDRKFRKEENNLRYIERC